MRKIAVLTSGGDGPALNACIRAVTREALRHGAKVYGVRWGYKGLINGEIDELTSRSWGRRAALSSWRSPCVGLRSAR
jgi:6-phosphofructokinase 1